MSSFLRDAGAEARLEEFPEGTESAADAAEAVGCALGQIVKSLVFLVGGRPVLALVAGDRRCRPESLPQLLGLEGPVARADAETVREATGFAIGGVAPVGHPAPLPCAVDSSLARFDRLWAAAGHPHAVFPTSFPELLRLTRGIAGEIAEVAPG
ncbi:MAG: YbaK/EbsC family protein [Geminicoccaceae bacterium]